MADNTGSATDQQFVEYVARAIVDDPDAVKSTRKVDDQGVLITLQVAKDDMGKIIGKAGKTVSAMRVLLRVVGSRNEDSAEQRVNLKIYDPEGDEVELFNEEGDIDL